MKNYQVTGPGGGTYTVTLDDSGVVRVDGLLPSSVELLKFGVNRFMTRNKISALRGLGLVAGSYSWVTEGGDESGSGMGSTDRASAEASDLV